jgi:hypothetical protein
MSRAFAQPSVERMKIMARHSSATLRGETSTTPDGTQHAAKKNQTGGKKNPTTSIQLLIQPVTQPLTQLLILTSSTLLLNSALDYS